MTNTRRLCYLPWIMIWLACSVGASADAPAPWQPPAPAIDDSDWVQLQSGEWLKGEIIVLYSDKLEFDSSELGLQIFDWADIKIVRSGQVVQVRLTSGERMLGKLSVAGEQASVSGSTTTFERQQILTITAGKPTERNYWRTYLSFGANWRSGNTQQAEGNAKLQVIRRSVASRLIIDYLGNFSETQEEQTANNHRANGTWDYFLDDRLFLRPVFFEIFRDPFQNIDYRLTIGTGLGYELINTARTEWIISGGPGYQSTRFITVEEGESSTEATPVLTIATALDIALTSKLDFAYDYQIQLTNERSGLYSHHMVIGFIMELSSWLDFDVSLIWDRTEKPTADEDGNTPEQNDWRFIVGLGFDF